MATKPKVVETKPALQVITDAIHEIARYREPDLKEAHELIKSVMDAADLDDISDYPIVRIRECVPMLEVTVALPKSGRWSREHTYELPLEFFSARNPVYTAKKWRLKRDMDEVNETLVAARGKLRKLEAEHDEAVNAYHDFVGLERK